MHLGLHHAELLTQPVAGQADQRVLEHAGVHRAHRLQARGALFELRCLGIDALEHQLELGAALATQAAQLECLLGHLPARIAELACHLRFDLLGAVEHHLFEHLAALRQQLCAERGFEVGQAALHQAIGIARDTGRERLPCRQREHAGLRNAQCACRLATLLRDLRIDLLGSGQRVDQRVDLVEHHKAGERVGAEVVAPDRQVGLGDTGVGAEDEHRGVRRRQQAERQLGLGADRIEARRVEHHQALFEQRVRVVDQRVAPRRHLDTAFVVERRVVVGCGVVPEAERTCLLLGDELGACHGEQGLRQLLGVVDDQGEVLPDPRLLSQLAEREPVETCLDRQQRQRGRFVGVPGQLDRAHGRAPRRGGQHAAAGVGEKDRVDQLRLATRELGDKSDDQLFGGQPCAQRAHLARGGAVDQLMVGQETRKLVEPPR